MSTDDVTRTAVTADMERIFGGLARRKTAKKATSGQPTAPLAEDQEGGPSIRWLLALAALLSVGVAVATLILLPPTLRPAKSQVSILSPVVEVTPAEQTASATEPLRQVFPVAPPPTEFAAVRDPVQARATAPASTPDPRSAGETREVARNSASRPKADSLAARSPTPSRGRIPPRSMCRDAGDPRMCLYSEVRRADLQLREAYGSASELNIPVGEMRQVRRLWSRALERSEADPAGSVRTLEELTARLDQAHDELLDGSRR